MKRLFNWGTYDSLSSIIRNILTVRCYVPADWFLIVYFFSSILFFILINHARNRPLVILGVITIVLANLFPQNDIAMRFLRILLATSFISIGYIGKKYFLHKYSPFYILFSLIITMFAAALNKEIVYLSNAIILNPFYFVIAALSGTFFIIQFSQHLHNRWLNFIGCNTIIIMGMHSNINYMISYFTYLIPEFWFIMLMCALSFLILSIMIPILNRFLPKAIGKWK